MTVAPPIVDNDTTTIEAHDFELACEIGPVFEPPNCPNPAAWAVTLREHCGATWRGTFLMCEPHWLNTIARIGRSWCRECGATALTIDHVVNAERLKP